VKFPWARWPAPSFSFWFALLCLPRSREPKRRRGNLPHILNYGVYGIPSYVLIDRRGHVRSLGMGGGKGLEQMIKALIAEAAEKSEAVAPEKEDDTKKPVNFQ
jgi:hypothetical protein